MGLREPTVPSRIRLAADQRAGKIGAGEVALAIHLGDACIDAGVRPKTAIDLAPIETGAINRTDVGIVWAAAGFVDCRSHVGNRHAPRTDRTSRRFPSERETQSTAVIAG